MIITYHHIIPFDKIPKNKKSHEGWEWSLSPEQFKYHLNLLSKKGFHFVSMDEKLQEIEKFGEETYKNVVLSFDDGWTDNYTYAYPILKESDIPAIFYVTTKHIFNKNNDRSKITTIQLKELQNNKMTIGCHTRNHKTLTILNKDELTEEIQDSKNDLERILGCSVHHFAYPGGAFDKKAVDKVREAGFKSACSILSPAIISKKDKYWMYRNHFSNNMNSLQDNYRLSEFTAKLFQFRIKKRLNKKLSVSR